MAAGAAAGISATFNAPLAGVIFASEIILGSFAVESLTPIVVASVLADVVQQHYGEHRMKAAFPELEYGFHGAWEQLPSYVLLGLICGLAAVGFTKLLYAVEDLGKSWFPQWWVEPWCLGPGGCRGCGVSRSAACHVQRSASPDVRTKRSRQRPYLFGVGYHAVDHALHLTMDTKRPSQPTELCRMPIDDKIVVLTSDDLAGRIVVATAVGLVQAIVDQPVAWVAEDPVASLLRRCSSGRRWVPVSD